MRDPFSPRSPFAKALGVTRRTTVRRGGVSGSGSGSWGEETETTVGIAPTSRHRREEALGARRHRTRRVPKANSWASPRLLVGHVGPGAL